MAGGSLADDGTSKEPTTLVEHALFDDVVRPPQHRRRDRQAERLRRLEVDDQLELRWLLDGQIAGLRTLENLVHVGRGAPEQVSTVRSIGHQAPGIHSLPQWVHCR